MQLDLGLLGLDLNSSLTPRPQEKVIKGEMVYLGELTLSEYMNLPKLIFDMRKKGYLTSVMIFDENKNRIYGKEKRNPPKNVTDQQATNASAGAVKTTRPGRARRKDSALSAEG